LAFPSHVPTASWDGFIPIHLGGEVYSVHSAITNPRSRSPHFIVCSPHGEFLVCPTVSFVVTSEGNRKGLPLGGPSLSDCDLGIRRSSPRLGVPPVPLQSHLPSRSHGGHCWSLWIVGQWLSFPFQTFGGKSAPVTVFHWM
jgi:hypothetical protein